MCHWRGRAAQIRAAKALASLGVNAALLADAARASDTVALDASNTMLKPSRKPSEVAVCRNTICFRRAVCGCVVCHLLRVTVTCVSCDLTMCDAPLQLDRMYLAALCACEYCAVSGMRSVARSYGDLTRGV